MLCKQAACLILALGLGSAAAPWALAQSTSPDASGQYRRLAPGVLKVITPEKIDAESFSRHDLVEVIANDPQYGVRQGLQETTLAKDVRFAHNVWALEFAFKTPRFVRVGLPQPDGTIEQKLVWYMVYSVRNISDQPVRFIPNFTLKDLKSERLYADSLLAPAIDVIREREDPNRPLLNTVDISKHELSPGGDSTTALWGVVTWEDIDLKVNRFSISIAGLTNAYRWEDPPGAYTAGDPLGTGRRLTFKTLQLNFWRPGDAFYEHESEIRYGIPGEVDYLWEYR